MKSNPTSRKSDLVVQELKGEVLIYDLQINKAYCLNETSAMVYNLCDGKHSVSEIRESIGRKLKQPVSEDLIWLALDQLKQDNLLDNSSEIETKLNGVSRREVIRRVGLSSLVALPIIASLVAPSAVDAQSSTGACAGGGEACVGENFTQGTCCAGSYCFNGGCIFCFPEGRTCGIDSVCCSGSCTGTGLNPGVCL